MQPPDAHLGLRRAWDAVAAEYARLIPDMSTEAPLDRAVIAAFAEMVSEHRAPLVADVGCGAGRLTKHLHDKGLHVLGLDLSPAMTATARALCPALPLAAADARALPLRDGVLGGLVAWYSLINLPTEVLSAVFTEFARVTSPGAVVLIAFQSGDGELVERTTSYGLPLKLTYFRHRVVTVQQALAAAGFTLHATVDRRAALSFESTSQAALLAHRNAL